MSAAQVHRPDPARTLVAFHSRDGHTRRIAQEIAQACQADLEEIRAIGDRSGWLGYLRCAIEALLGIRPALPHGTHRPERYGLVVIGTPIWFWNVSSPVRAWIARHHSRLPHVALFCTCGGSGQGKVLADLERLVGQHAVATLALTEAQCADPHHHESVERFARACLGEAGPRAHGDAVERPAT